MQKVHTINLGGIVFQIEEDAYDLLRNYIESIRQYFRNSSGGSEISNDIEYRLGEMLSEKLQNGKNLIVKPDVEQIIGIMGQPKDFGYEEGGTSTDTSKTETKTKRKFFRDPDNKIIGGVCSGIASFFGIEQIWIVRLVFVASLFIFSLFGFGLLTYILLWIVVPKAKTTADKLAMKGESVNIENIAKSFEDGVKKLDSGSFYTFMKKLGNFIESVIVACLKFFSRITGAILLFVTAILFIVLFALVSLKNEHINVGMGSLSDFMNYVIPVSVDPKYMFICLFVLIGIPLFYLLLLSLKLLGAKFGLSRYVHFAAIFLFLISAFGGLYLAIKVVEEFSMESSTVQTLKIDVKEETLNLVPYGKADNAGVTVISMDGDKSGFMVTDSGIYIRDIKLVIEKSNNEDVELVYTTSARGTNKKEALANEKSIEYKFSKVDETLFLDTYFRLPKGNSWRVQNVELKLRLPEGKQIKLDPFINQFDLDVNDGEDFMYDYDKDELEGKTLQMTDEGLQCIDCDGPHHAGHKKIKIKKFKNGGVNIDISGAQEAPEEPEMPEIPDEPEEPKKP